jgi:hypothetical protein
LPDVNKPDFDPPLNLEKKDKKKATKMLGIFGFVEGESWIPQILSKLQQLKKYMKTPRWFTRNRLLSQLRIATAVTITSAAAAMAFVAVNNSSPLLSGSSAPTHEAINKFRQDRDFGGNKLAIPGLGQDRGPLDAALEAFALRAYPADDVPTEASLNAIASFKQIKARGAAVGNGKNTLAQWHLIGPSNAIFPDILTFSGQQYVTSGRITALAIAPNCTTNGCRLYVAAAGGGVWRTDNALGGAGWTFLSDSFGTNAIGSLLLDPSDPTANTIYAGTGEPNASGDSEAGVGIYKSTDGGNTWAIVPGSDIFFQRAIGQMDFDNTGKLLVPIASGVRGVSSVTSGASSSAATGHPLVTRGLWRQTGSTFTLIWPSPAPVRGSTTVKVDPTHPGFIYVNAFQQGIWRSTDNGATFTQIFTPQDPTVAGSAIDRSEFDVTTLAGGATRMYVGEGQGGGAGHHANFWRSDNADTTATFAQMGGAQVDNYCTGQCWYDNFVVTPKGSPDVVYLGGSYDYNNYGRANNGRGVLYSTDGGSSWTDETWDATTEKLPKGSWQPSPTAANGIHPDQHALVVNPSNPGQFFDGSDGGLMRSTGSFADISSQCTARGLTGADLTFCQGLLSRVPSHLYSMNNGLSTLQFQSVSVAADDPKHLQGGTQDNGTFESTGSTTWPQIIYGDGGQSGFMATNSSLRFNTFTGQANDANFQNGDPRKWVIISAPILSSPEGAYFYPPIIADPNPANAGSIFQGSFSVWRTQDWGGSQAYLEANCPEFTTLATQPGCGDFVVIGDGAPSTQLTSGAWGTRAGGAVAWIQRAPQNTGTAWAATGTGRVFITDNANDPAASVHWNRLDPSPATIDPNRAISAIYVDPANAHHAWISYNGYNVNTPTLPGHVFDVTWSGAGAATWVNVSYNLPDFPITALVSDDATGDLYAASDFGVMQLPFGTTTWAVAGAGLPMVEVPGLTIVPGARTLYAATHGRSAWSLALP